MNKFKTEIKWGFIFSGCALLWALFEKQMGWHSELINKQLMYTNLFALVAIVVFVLALLDKKKNDFKGEMTWKQGFIGGIVLSAVVALLSPATQYITQVYISPEYFSNIVAYIVEAGRMKEDKALEFFNLNNYIRQGIFTALSMGVVTAAIVSFALKNKKQ